MDFKKLMQKEQVVFDGAMGTELQKRGLKPGQPSELLNFTAPDKVAEVIRAYAKAGSDIISANTFCANRYKLAAIGKNVDETVTAAIKIAKEALHDFPNVLVALDVSPIGKLLRPAGTLTFNEAYEIFAEMIKAAEKAGAGLVVLQTFSDLLELKCALLAVKENSTLPVICSMTFEQNGRTFTGCPVSAYAVTASGLGADVIGVNCSLGPKELYGIADELLRFSDVPVMVKPNAGLPDPVTGKFVLNAEGFSEEMRVFAEKGVKVLGGCCGTSPEYIKLMKSAFENISVNAKEFADDCAITSGTKTVILDQPRVIGERINPTGKRVFKEALLNDDTDYILGQAFEQTAAGADILDVNVGLPEIDEREMMLKVLESLQSVCDLPLQIDSGNPSVVEAALRRYNGKPIVNSVNGKEESLNVILPLVKKYGAAVIGLTLDENGIPETAEKRLEIAERILNRALKLGIKRSNIIIDCLTLTVSTDSTAAQTTLEAVRLVNNRLGLKTALGVSNISFGLPNRDLLNASFLTAALQCGLTLPIINPNSATSMGAVRSFRLLKGNDPNACEYIKAYSQKEPVNQKEVTGSQISLGSAIENGMKKDAAQITERLLKEILPMSVINEHLIPALDKAGVDFEGGAIFLPQLILSAETAGVCFDIVKRHMPDTDSSKKSPERIVLATVKGDIHDIGKNIVKVLLENYGYQIIDLGKDVAPDTIVESAVKHNVKLIGLSALMTTTLPPMEQTIALIKERGLNCKVMVGGAVLNADYANIIGADYYAKDAKGAVDIAKKFFA
ncbi:MAG: homocysteine S-methyltransferase family protein [Oscillospiraceae bacterium]|nr:homocysteine S-methyltransferase family protein [Oscillospiraceae bacterium]